MQKLLDALEQHGFRDEDGTLLSNSSDWHQLRQQIAALKAYAVEADKIVKILQSQYGHNGPMVYQIGEATMDRVFRPNGLENVSDMQTVFDAVERALAEVRHAS